MVNLENYGYKLFGAYLKGALWTTIASCFINGRISEQQIDAAKEAFSKSKEYEIDHFAILPEKKEELKRQCKLWLEATTQGIKDELRAQEKLL